ncbi:hypothetical protein CEP51_011692 [Fusarium floridanum]|uniref:Uncharacterized protein n=1 Tax=Fusarium floridanum TaxID=1325733 RepID=A0A428R956_9HYPO|nr:hypothetical protein CEP51_011692 [Fusarium floridanum]
MRLLNTTSLKLEYFVGDEIPNYAILSHKWEAEEILFEDLQTDGWPQKKGADKVKRACLQANDDGFEYIWIDTCCIDKSSSAELSEAINSMFNWYYRSQIGDRLSLLESIVSVTGIDRRVLGRGEHHQLCRTKESSWIRCRCGGGDVFEDIHRLLSPFSVATRMSWASTRVTTRVEDQAYALLGLFNVNMPLLYGEGTKAFRRLQEEIIRNSNDQSILAGQHQLCLSSDLANDRNHNILDDVFDHLFPSHPRAFKNASPLERVGTSSKHLSMTLTNRCLNIDLHMCPCWSRRDPFASTAESGWLGILASVYSDDYLSRPAILLDRVSSPVDDRHVFTRTRRYQKTLIRVSPDALPDRNTEVEISQRGLVVRLNPSRIQMMNIDLLIHPPTSAQGTRTLAIRVNPTIGGHDDMAYRIWASFPDLEQTPDGQVRSAAFAVEDLQGATPNRFGLVAIGDDGSNHAFFVAYGFSVQNTEVLDSAAPLKFDPWCRLLEWHRIMSNREYIPKDDELVSVVLEEMAGFSYWYNYVPSSTEDGSHLYDSMDWSTELGLRAQVALTPNTFLGQTAYELTTSVWRT